MASCGGPPEGVAPGNATVGDGGTGTPAGLVAEHVACAIGDGPFRNDCTIERAPASGGTLLTIRQPDGGFRRLLLAADGTSVTSADGALPVATTSRSATAIDVAIGDARYRLPLER